MAQAQGEAGDGLERYKKERARAFRKQLRAEMLTSVLPVFLGAVWSEAMMGCFEMMFKDADNDDAKIAAVFMYTIALHIGVVYGIYKLQGHLLEDFAQEVLTEVAGFAWKDATYVLLVHRLSGSHGTTYGLTLVIAFIASLIVYLNGYLRHRLFTPGTHLQIDLSSFESQVFALSISFTINQAIYFTIFGKVGEEVYTADDDAVEDETSHTYQQLLLLLWAIGITLLVAWLQRADARKNIMDEDDMYVTRSSERDDSPYAVMDEFPVRESIIDEFSCGGVITSGMDEGPCAAAIHKTVFAWDTTDMTWHAFRRLINTSLGYAVGCAWFVWSIKMFADNLDQLAFIGTCLIYAVTMTILGSFVMARFQIKLELETESLTTRRSRQLMISAYRLTVGWGWGEFIAAVLITISDEETSERVMGKLAVAIFATAYAFWREYLNKSNETFERKFDSTGSIVAENTQRVSLAKNDSAVTRQEQLEHYAPPGIELASAATETNNQRSPEHLPSTELPAATV